MASENLLVDGNNKPVIGMVTDDSNQFIKMGRIDDTTKGLKVMLVGGVGTGTVTSVSVATANGVSGSVATATTTPAITLTLGAITPTSVTASGTLAGSNFSGSSSGVNTGDQTNISGNAATVTTNANLTGVITSVGNATSIASQTGTGTKFVVDNTPTLITPVLGVATATSINGLTLTASTGTLSITNLKTLTISNSLTLAGTDGKGINIGAATAGKILIGDGSNMVLSTPTFPTTAGTSGNVLTSDGTNFVSSAPASSGSMTLLKANSGTSTTTSANDLDTIAITGLTAKDTILIYYTASAINNTGGTLAVTSSTDTNLVLANIADGTAIAQNGDYGGQILIRQEQQSSTVYFSTRIDNGSVGGASIGGNTDLVSRVNLRSNAATTAWTGSWTMGLRSGGVTSGGTIRWSWAVYKIVGQ